LPNIPTSLQFTALVYYYYKCPHSSLFYTLSEAWSGVNWVDLMAAQDAFGTDFDDRSILRPKHRAYYRSGRPVIKIGTKPKGALGSHEIRPIHSAPSLGQSIRYVGQGLHKGESGTGWRPMLRSMSILKLIFYILINMKPEPSWLLSHMCEHL